MLFLLFGYNLYVQKSKNQQRLDKIKIANQKSTKILMNKMRKMLEEQNAKLKQKSKQKQTQKKEIKKEIAKIQKQVPKKDLKDKNSSIIKTTPKIEKHVKILKQNYLSEVHDYEKSLKYTRKQHKIVKKAVKYKGKPKLAIIIDDVSFAGQVKQIEAIPYKITPSFFPPSKRHPRTAKLAKKFKFAMVHLPLEALGYNRPEIQTLLFNDNRQTVLNRIREIKKEFPEIHYYNNHTGSRFTADTKAMQRLISIMKDENLHFVDSRTTVNTKAGIVSKALHVRLLSRDVFLDNIAEPKYIIMQLKKAVQLAKKSGYAIAIGHPHKNTLSTLMHAKRYLKDVRLVYVNEL